MNQRLSKAEVAKLNEEQLEAYARIHLDSERKLRVLRDQATGRNRSLFIPAAYCVVGAIVIIWYPNILSDPFNLVGLLLMVILGLHWRTNQRIDAIFSLLEIDQSKCNKESEQVEDGDAEEGV